MRNFSLVLIAAFFVFAAGAAQAQESGVSQPLEITRITPEGADVPAGRQIVITFNRAVVPLGRMERSAEEIPVSITPALDCEWRWINPSSLACQLGEQTAMKQSTAYKLTVNPGITAEDAATIAAPFEHSFITQRADVRHSWFQTWRSPATPVIRVTFNQPVTLKSAEKALSFEAGGKNTKIKLSVPEYAHDPIEKNGVIYHRVLIAEPAKELPLDTSVTLKLSAGLISSEGDAPAIAARDVTVFDTFPAFSFVGLRCSDNSDAEINIAPGQKSDAKCNPMAPVALRFSVPVMRGQVKQHVTFNPAFGAAAAADDVWGDLSDEYSRLGRAHQKGQTYDVFLPQGLKAVQVYTVSLGEIKRGFWARIGAWFRSLFGKTAPATALQDEFGRALPQGFMTAFATDNRRPNFELIHNTAVLERQTDSDVPLYVTNLQKTIFNFRGVTSAGMKDGQKHETALPDVRNIQYAIPFGVREALGGKSGAVFGHLSTEPDVPNKSPYERKLFAQVTPWQVHVKIGHFSSLVWVTDMASGAPVEGAKVTFYRDALSSMSVPTNDNTLANARTDARGLARLSGTETIDPMLELARGYGDDTPRVFVRVDKGEDMALLPAAWEFGIDIWRASNESIYAESRRKFGHIRAWGATAQGIYRAGDTIDYKIYVRNENDRTLEPAPRTGYKLEIVDPMDNVVSTTEDVRLNNFGSFAGQYTVAANAPVGWYKFRLSGEFSPEQKSLNEYQRGHYTWTPINVLVSDFTPAPFRAATSLNGDLFADGQDVTVQSTARLHSGGPYTDANARVTAMLEPRGFTPKNPATAGFYFAASEDEQARQLYQTTAPLNAQGDLESVFKIEANNVVYGRLTVETAVQDDRGKYIASQAQADFVGRDRFVGVRGTQWVYNAKTEAKIEYIVADPRGDITEGVPVKVQIEKQVTKSAKVKGAGNAYLTQYSVEWEVAAACEGVSAKGAETCAFTPDSAGYYRAIATIEDTQKRAHSSTQYLWVAGRDYVMWHNESDVLLPIVPEKAEYNVGDTARYLVKNPWPGAEALVTVERYGVIDSFTMKLEGSTPVIEIPVKPDYLPGFYLSIVVTSPRAAEAPIEGGVDLGKPSFRMGYVTVPVKDPHKQMVVSIKTDAEVYRPRDKVTVTLNAQPKHPEGREPVEIAVAVLDEAVFDLIAGGAKAYDPYSGFYKLEGLDLKNYNLLTRLIGRQKFEKKGANPGGDGGSDFAMRDLFKFVAYWNPALHADSNGNASFTFDLPDNLTGWRVLAMAVTPTDRLGLGQGTFKVNRPTEVRPVMPNQVTERDSFKAGFSVMNRTDKARTLDVNISVEGPVDTAQTPAKITQQVTLEPYKRTTVYMPVQTAALPETSAQEKGELVFTIRAQDALDADGMVHRMPVGKMRSLETAASYGTTTGDKASESILFPEGIYPDVGGVSVVLAPSVIAPVEGAFKYMRDYPYLCWEQILSKGVMAAHYLNLKSYMPDSLTWEGSDKLPQTTLDSAASFQAPNGGMSYFIARDEYVSPYLSAYTALAFNWMRASGHKVPEAVEKKLHGYLQNFLRNDTAPGFYTEGMRSTVRAVALAALSAHEKVTLDDMQRYRPHVKGMSLFGKAHYMRAALNFKEGGDLAAETAKDILSYANQTGGKFMFSEELDDSYRRILATPLRDNCAILDAFTVYAGREEGHKLAGDMPFKLVRTITQTRKNRDHWENTQENMFCMNALTSYSRVYEKDPVAMEVTAKLDGATFGAAAFTDLRDAPVTLARGMQGDDAGHKTTLDIERSGSGRLYYAARLQYAPKSDFSKPVNSGIEIRREYSVERDGAWQLLKPEDSVKRGEIVRADIYLSLPAARNFVVVDDPLPGGLESVNRDLATASTVDAAKGEQPMAGGAWWFKFRDWVSYGVSRWSFYHKELRHDRAVFYSDYLPAGNYHLSYTAQAIAEGAFVHMPVHAEEMYDPDVYGKGVRGRLDVAAP
ncbi:MAG: alpha-2-macroglobulin family protein [Alphaproteobacteria bacterium]|nr:alpha-2-macroglobulin family protein [Alphaproteobacteria bacterium]